MPVYLKGHELLHHYLMKTDPVTYKQWTDENVQPSIRFYAPYLIPSEAKHDPFMRTFAVKDVELHHTSFYEENLNRYREWANQVDESFNKNLKRYFL